MKKQQKRSGETISEARQKAGMTLRSLAESVGISSPHMSHWETGKSEPSDRVASGVARVLNLDFESLRQQLEEERYVRKKDKLDRSFPLQASPTNVLHPEVSYPTKEEDMIVAEDRELWNLGIVIIPILGEVPAGDPIYVTSKMRQEAEGYVAEGASDISDPDSAFALRVRGDSMIGEGINDGHIVIVDAGLVAEDGDLAVVMLDNEATLKRVHFDGDQIILESANPNVKPRIVRKNESGTFRIVGTVIRHSRKTK